MKDVNSKKNIVVSRKKTGSEKSSAKNKKSITKSLPLNAPKRKHKILNIVLMLIFIFIIGMLATVLFYTNFHILYAKQIDISVYVRNGSSAFNTSTDALNFAKISPGGVSTKKIDINSYRDSIVRLETVGNISDFISYSDNNFVMKKNEYKQVEITLALPENVSEGEYSGKLKVYLYRK